MKLQRPPFGAAVCIDKGAGLASVLSDTGGQYMQAEITLRPESGAKLAVYSCYFGAHEPFNPAATGADGQGYDRYVFTDHKVLPTTARLVRLTDRGEGSAILSRLPKLCPHVFFQGYDWLIYLDNNARFLLDPARIVKRVVKEHPDQPLGRYLFRHRRRDCAWDEADECLRLGYMTPEQHAKVTEVFRRADFPRHAGLFVNTCLISRMGDPVTEALSMAWYASLGTHTRRDQVMLPWLLASHHCPHRVLSAKVKSWADWPIYSPKAREKFRTGQNPT